jgi:glutathione S-transferase
MKPRLWSFRTSPFAGKVRVAFAEKDVDYELVEIHPKRRPPRLKELNVAGRVPTLELEDGAIRESSVIFEWLEETHPEPPLWPASATRRGWARGWAKYVDDTATSDFFLGMRKFAFGLAPDDPEDVVQTLFARVPRRWPTLERALAEHDGPWLAGEQFTYADICAAPLAVRLPEWAPQLQPDPEATPLVAAWLAALRDRPSSVAIDAHAEPVLSA